MDVLVVFAEHPGEVLPRAVILDAVWAEPYVADAVLTRAIAVLRRVLRDDARDPRYIETIPKRGYRLIADVDGAPRRRVSDRYEADPASGWSLFVLEMEDREVELSQGNFVIGRAEDADIHICARNVSRHHARLSVHRGEVSIEDLGSKNGTWCRGRRLTSPRRLADGDRFVLGEVMIVLRDRSLQSTDTGHHSGSRAGDPNASLTPPDRRRTGDPSA